MPALTGNTIQDLILDWFKNNFTAGAANVRTVASDVATDASITVEIGITALAVGSWDTGDISMCTHGTFVITEASTGTIAVHGVYADGTVTPDELYVTPVTATQEALPVTGVLLAAGTYKIKDLAYQNLRFTAATSTVDAIVGLLKA